MNECWAPGRRLSGVASYWVDAIQLTQTLDINKSKQQTLNSQLLREVFHKLKLKKSEAICIFSFLNKESKVNIYSFCKTSLVFNYFINLLWKVIMSHSYTLKSFFSTKTHLINWSSNSLLFSAQCWIFLHCIHNLPERFYCKKKLWSGVWKVDCAEEILFYVTLIEVLK